VPSYKTCGFHGRRFFVVATAAVCSLIGVTSCLRNVPLAILHPFRPDPSRPKPCPMPVATSGNIKHEHHWNHWTSRKETICKSLQMNKSTRKCTQSFCCYNFVEL
jgi:hypothetical protein